MEQTQLVELVKSLKPEEVPHLQQFSSISMFNSSKISIPVSSLLDYCLKHFRSNVEQKLEKQEVYEAVYPNQVFIEGKLEKTMVEAQKVLRSFLTIQHYLREENKFQQQLDLADGLRARGLENRSEQIEDRLQKMQEEENWELRNFYQQFQLEFSRYENETTRNKAKGDLNIPRVIYALEVHYHINKLVLANQFLLQRKVAHLEMPDSIKAIIEESETPSVYLEASIYLRLNFEIFCILKKDLPEVADAQNLFDLLLKNEKELNNQSLADLYAFLRNLCVLAISRDYENMDMAKMLQSIYEDNLKKGYLHSKGKISRSKYMAVATNALFVGNYDWARDFIEGYKDELQGENETRDIYRLNLANYLFRVGQFSECLDNIPDSSPFLLYLLLGKRLELKCLYELQSDLLSYKLDAFKMFLSRTTKKHMADFQRQVHTDFANFLSQLQNSIPGDVKRAQQLLKRIQEKKQSAEWRWLIEKAQALKVPRT